MIHPTNLVITIVESVPYFLDGEENLEHGEGENLRRTEVNKRNPGDGFASRKQGSSTKVFYKLDEVWAL